MHKNSISRWFKVPWISCNVIVMVLSSGQNSFIYALIESWITLWSFQNNLYLIRLPCHFHNWRYPLTITPIYWYKVLSPLEQCPSLASCCWLTVVPVWFSGQFSLVINGLVSWSPRLLAELQNEWWLPLYWALAITLYHLLYSRLALGNEEKKIVFISIKCKLLGSGYSWSMLNIKLHICSFYFCEQAGTYMHMCMLQLVDNARSHSCWRHQQPCYVGHCKEGMASLKCIPYQWFQIMFHRSD